MTAEDLAAADETRPIRPGRPAGGGLAERQAAARAFRPRRALPAIVVSALLAVARSSVVIAAAARGRG